MIFLSNPCKTVSVPVDLELTSVTELKAKKQVVGLGGRCGLPCKLPKTIYLKACDDKLQQ